MISKKQNDSKLNNYNLLNLLESTDGYSMSILIHLLVKQLALIFFSPQFHNSMYL